MIAVMNHFAALRKEDERHAFPLFHFVSKSEKLKGMIKSNKCQVVFIT